MAISGCGKYLFGQKVIIIPNAVPLTLKDHQTNTECRRTDNLKRKRGQLPTRWSDVMNCIHKNSMEASEDRDLWTSLRAGLCTDDNALNSYKHISFETSLLYSCLVIIYILYFNHSYYLAKEVL